MSFENLKRNRDQISKLVQAAESVGGSTETKSYVDERLWKPTVDRTPMGQILGSWIQRSNWSVVYRELTYVYWST